jgi:putative transposase
MQSAQLPAIKEVRPEYNEINAQVLQDVLHRLDRPFAAFFRRVQAGERPGYPRFQGKDRYHSFTYPQVGAHGGAALDGGMLSVSKIGRIRLRLHRPLAGTPRRSRSAGKQTGGMPASPVRRCPSSRCL